MGRWFGYRPGYDDLCRVWMPEEAQGWYEHIAEATEELREELRVMQAANATPQQFGLKVRSDPETLIVTARNKMGTGETLRVSIGLSKTFIETAILRNDIASLEINRDLAKSFATQLADLGQPLSKAQKVPGGWLLNGIPPGPIEDFISGFQNSPGCLKTDPGPVRRYIEQRRDTEFAKWDVLFAAISEAEPYGLVDTSLGISLNCQRRGRGKPNPGNPSDEKTTLRITNKQRVASRGIEKTGLTSEQVATAEAAWIREKGSQNFPDRIYRQVRERPLLIVHMLAIGNKEDDLSQAQPVVAWSISFPATRLEQKLVEYVVNTTWWRENYRDELDDDDAGGDEDG
jgi:Z1 domain